jgi:hypothetical protein
MGVPHDWLWLIEYVALSVYPLYAIWFIDSHSPWNGYPHLQLRDTCYSCWFWSYKELWNVHPRKYLWWQNRQRRGRLTGVCINTVLASDKLDGLHIEGLDSHHLSPGWAFCITLMFSSGLGEEDDNENKWEVLRNIWMASSQNGISNNQFTHSTQAELCCGWLQVTRVSHCLEICRNWVWCWLFFLLGIIVVYKSWNLTIVRS